MAAVEAQGLLAAGDQGVTRSRYRQTPGEFDLRQCGYDVANKEAVEISADGGWRVDKKSILRYSDGHQAC